jgi:hypothetical protein
MSGFGLRSRPVQEAEISEGRGGSRGGGGGSAATPWLRRRRRRRAEARKGQKWKFSSSSGFDEGLRGGNLEETSE